MSNQFDDADELEDHYFPGRRREERQARKIVTAADRSKYKKTDADKRKAPTVTKEGERARVLSIGSLGILCELETTQQQLVCTLRGGLKKERTQFKNLVIAGDWVQIKLLEGDEGVILGVEPRSSLLSRADNLSRRREHLIAANIDQVLVTASVVTPHLKPGLLDRYIIAAKKGGMEPVLVINKIDLLEDAEEDEQDTFQRSLVAFKEAGYPIIAVSCEEQDGLAPLREVMKGKSSVFSGQSGVGKSSLINAFTGRDLETRETRMKTRKGVHTTTQAQLLPLDCGGWVIDTPGIKSFGVWNLDANELESYYPDIAELGQDCKYPDCRHLEEPSCAVHKAVESEQLDPLRLDSFHSLLNEIHSDHKRR